MLLVVRLCAVGVVVDVADWSRLKHDIRSLDNVETIWPKAQILGYELVEKLIDTLRARMREYFWMSDAKFRRWKTD
jgi:hypothetical protein